MDDAIYRRLQRVLDTLPNGFPETEDGLEIRLLKKIFAPEEAELFCDLKLHFETADQIAERTGRPLEGLEEMLSSMWQRGEILGAELGGIRIFKMIPWVVGIYEFQIDRMDREFAEMADTYIRTHLTPALLHKPEIMQVAPVKSRVPAQQRALAYQQVSAIIDAAQSFAVNACICNKSEKLQGRGCDKPDEICLGLSQVPGVFENHPWGRPITREEAYAILDVAEERGLVHLTSNVQSDHMFICNCCGCCCPVLGTLKRLGTAEHVNATFVATIDPAACTACGICADERCQMDAIEMDGDVYRVIQRMCIGCGLCVSTCPEDAVSLIERPDAERRIPPADEDAWMAARAASRGVDYSEFK